MATISERIKEGLSIRNMKQVDLIEKTGINKGALSSYISGKYEPKQKNIYLIAKALNVNEAWLIGCDVPMEVLDEQNTLSKLSEIELTLLDDFNKLNSLGKDEAIKRVSELTEINKYTSNDLEFNTIAAHDDDLTEEEKENSFAAALECIKKHNK